MSVLNTRIFILFKLFIDLEMSRISAGGIASLFKGISPGTKSPIPIPSGAIPSTGMLPELIFAHGHVQEHNAVTVVGNHSTNIHGQDPYARDLEHIDKTVHKVQDCASVEEVVAILKKEWADNYMRIYAKKLGAEGTLALEELAIIDQCIQAIQARLKRRFTNIGHIVKEEASKSFGSEHTLSNGIVYNVPRFSHNINGITVICQPDGSCIYDDKLSIVEIKSCYGSMYTAKASLSSTNKRITSNANISKWLHYLIQVCVEMFPEEFGGTLFVCWQGSKIKGVSEKNLEKRENKANYIHFTRGQMAKLMNAVRAFTASLAPEEDVEGATYSTSPYELYEQLSSEKKKESLRLYKETCKELIAVFKTLPKTQNGDVWSEWPVEEAEIDEIMNGEEKVEDGDEDEMHVIANNMHRFNKEFDFLAPINLELDTDNEHDSNAIKVMSGGSQVAWIAGKSYIQRNVSKKFPEVDLYDNKSLAVIFNGILQTTFEKRSGGTALLKIKYSKIEIVRAKR